MWKRVLSITIAVVFSIAIAAPDGALADDDDNLTVDVIPDLATFSFVDVDGSGGPTAGDPFIVEGGVFRKGTTTLIGHYLCRGFFITPQADGDFTYVTQSFEIFNRGSIHVEGNESPFLTFRAITGVTGNFEAEEGAVLIADPKPGLGVFAFRATFVFDD